MNIWFGKEIVKYRGERYWNGGDSSSVIGKVGNKEERFGKKIES